MTIVKRMALLVAMIFMVTAAGCGDSAGVECCDCLIDNGCWGSAEYACYYYYDEDYSGEQEDPPPGQTWTIACQDEHCPICEEVDSNFTD